jgi:hypothetical protein
VEHGGGDCCKIKDGRRRYRPGFEKTMRSQSIYAQPPRRKESSCSTIHLARTDNPEGTMTGKCSVIIPIAEGDLDFPQGVLRYGV